MEYGCKVQCVVVLFSEVGNDGDEVDKFLLHFLVVASALFSLASAYKDLHGFEYLVHPAHVAVHEMAIVHFEEPVVAFVFFH